MEAVMRVEFGGASVATASWSGGGRLRGEWCGHWGAGEVARGRAADGHLCSCNPSQLIVSVSCRCRCDDLLVVAKSGVFVMTPNVVTMLG
jgi:hypothetical protein